jgi:hypothetical protein
VTSVPVEYPTARSIAQLTWFVADRDIHDAWGLEIGWEG